MAEKKSLEELQREAAELQIQLQRDQLEFNKQLRSDAEVERELNQRRLLESRNKEQEQRRTQMDRAKQMSDEEERRRQRVFSCPHRKGGMDLAGYRAGDGDKYAVFKHRWCNGDIAITCQRCSNIVLPPIEPLAPTLEQVDLLTLELYGHKTPLTAGFFGKSAVKEFAAAKRLYAEAIRQYNFWLKMRTDNVESESNQLKQLTSSSNVFNFDRMYRLALHESLNIPIFQAQKWPDSDKEKIAA